MRTSLLLRPGLLMPAFLIPVFLILGLLLPLSALAQTELQIAVAANFKPTLNKLLAAYQNQYGQQRELPQFQVSSASTGILYAQIRHGAPYDLFFAADSQSVDRLQNEFSLPPQRSFRYAQGQLIFLCRRQAPETMTELEKWQGRFAQANPKLAPYGRATTEVTAALGWDDRNTRISAANVAQVSHYIDSGAIDCGFTARSLLPSDATEASYLIIPTSFHQPISQKAIHLDQPDQPSAELSHFIDFVTQQGQSVIVDAGYSQLEQDR